MRMLAGNSTAARAPRERLTLINGVPATVVLKYPQGKRVSSLFGEDQIMYMLADGRTAYLDLEVAAQIDALGLAPGQPFTVCKHGPGRWEVRDATPKNAPAARQEPPKPKPGPQPTPPSPAAQNAPQPALSAARVNGAGEDVAAIMTRCYSQAVEIALGAVEFARSKGLIVSPSFEDVRCIAATLVITATGGRK